MFHIHVWNQSQSQSLNNSPNYTCHSRTLIFLFCLSLSYSDVTVYLDSHRMGSIVGVRDSNLSPTGLLSLFLAYFYSYLPSLNLLPSGLGWIVLVGGAVNVAVVVAFSCCCAIEGLPQLGVNGLLTS